MRTRPTTLVLDQLDQVLWIRLNRPEARNAIDPVMRDELLRVFEEMGSDRTIRCAVITARGPDFCIGADLRPAGNPDIAMTRSASPLDSRRGVARYQGLFAALLETEIPVVNGTTAGGGWLLAVLALLADIVVAVRGARWTHAFTRRGTVPHCGDPFFLPRILFFHRLHEAALLGETLTSEDLAGWGAVNRLVAGHDLESTASDLASRLAHGPTRTLGGTKRLDRWSVASDMATSFSEEAAAVALVSQTDDRLEGVRSLVEGRAAEFTGH
jgi:2-(1,2-epoxy-1,2-dihydrophenyl)acetyl-CoA isomerase